MGRLAVTEKPTILEDYVSWLQSNHRIEISKITQTHYETSMAKVKGNLEESDFWKNLPGTLKLAGDEYFVSTGGYKLFLTDRPPEIQIKPFASLLDKSFRKNVLENKEWPSQPTNGWVFPSNWLTRINDIFRTSLIVKYMDGVELAAGKIKSLCDKAHLECQIHYEATEQGYYAAHVSIRHDLDVPNIRWEPERTEMTIEIQVATQLQELIRGLTHRYYEAARSRPMEEEIKWQWNFQSDEFAPYYLGHMLHYIEGMIMEIRKKQRRV